MRTSRVLAAALLLGAAPLSAQYTPLAVGTVAPEFTLPAATQTGVLPRKFALSELRGRTVVLAFFFKARTSG